MVLAGTVPPNSHSETPRVFGDPRCFTQHTPLQTRTLSVTQACSEPVKLDPAQVAVHRKNPPLQSQSPWFASQGHRQSPYLSPDSTIAASYFKISFKIAARSSHHLTLSPSSGAPVQTVYAFTGNHPEHLGTGSPVWKLQPLCGR